jgi:sec-independent protein translocase protein TatA
MPSIGFGEILVILLIALIVFGPTRLPEMGRTIGKSLREFRRTASDLRAEIESDLDDDPPPPRSAMRTPRADGHAGRPADGETPTTPPGGTPPSS